MLKQLIQRLLDSRTTPEEAAHSAMPNSGIHITVGDETTTFIAPSDGYAFQNVGGGSGGVTTYSLINDTHLGIQSQCNSSNGNASRVFLPCRKGDKILCERQGSPKTNVTITFFATVGGGYLRSFISAVSKRGELCLKALSLCLPRSFSLVSGKPFSLGYFHEKVAIRSYLFHLGKIYRLFLLRMDGSSLLCETALLRESSPLVSPRLVGMVARGLISGLQRGIRHIGLFTKVSKLPSTCQRLIVGQLSNSILTTNLRTGGSLC